MFTALTKYSLCWTNYMQIYLIYKENFIKYTDIFEKKKLFMCQNILSTHLALNKMTAISQTVF